MLNWKFITPSNSPKFMVNGTELNQALCGNNSRFAIVEVRAYDASMNADRRYVVRDAATVSDAEIKAGIRPKIVANFNYEDEAINYCKLAT